MAGGEPEKGDKVSWNWGGGAPGGTVVEKKTEGEIAITSKRGNVIKKNASPDNPGIHIARSGNDVVKRASELNIEKKAGGGGQKRSHDASGDKEGDATVENAQGKEIRPGGKKAKKEDAKEEAAPKTNGAPKANEKKKKEEKATGGSAASGGGTKTKEKPKEKEKNRKPRSTDGISSRTRSQKK